VLLYSWSEVKAYDRFADASEDEAQAERTRAQAREVFRMAEARSCRHAQLAHYFGEDLADCGSSCDVCQNFELLSKKPARATAEERAFLAEADRWSADEYGYGHVQRTYPRSLAYGLNDSPAGLAAWIVDKFRAWADCGGDLE